MDQEQLRERIEALEKQRDQIIQQANLQIASLNGGIAECRWQLEQLAKAEPPVEPPDSEEA